MCVGGGRVCVGTYNGILHGFFLFTKLNNLLKLIKLSCVGFMSESLFRNNPYTIVTRQIDAIHMKAHEAEITRERIGRQRDTLY